MPFTFVHETITPVQAHAYLAKSAGNRALNQNYVLSLAVDMEAGRWDPNASEIVFDEDGALIDGHHRLHAIILNGDSVGVRTLVKRGVSRNARGIIDTGRTRSIADLMGMFRPGGDYIHQRRASLITCASLLIGARRPPQVRTLAQYDSWMRHFKDGIEAMFSKESGMMESRARPFLVGPVMGALAFAHKSNPMKVMAFARQLSGGEGLARTDAAYSLRALILSDRAVSRAGQERLRLARKVLNGALSHMKGLNYAKAQDGDRGLEHFRIAYDTRAMNDLVKSWSDGSAPAPAVSEAA